MKSSSFVEVKDLMSNLHLEKTSAFRRLSKRAEHSPILFRNAKWYISISKIPRQSNRCVDDENALFGAYRGDMCAYRQSWENGVLR